jgi:hypothetical protein
MAAHDRPLPDQATRGNVRDRANRDHGARLWRRLPVGLADWHAIIDGLAKASFDGALPLADLAGAVAEARASAMPDPRQAALKRTIAQIRARTFDEINSGNSWSVTPVAAVSVGRLAWPASAKPRGHIGAEGRPNEIVNA